MKLDTRLIAVVLGSALLLAACGQRGGGPRASASADTLSKVLRDHELRVAYIEYPPSQFKDPATGELRGHFVDTLKAILRELDPTAKIIFEETNWADFAASLNNHRTDLSIAGTFATIPRAKVVAFTRPLVHLGRSVIVRRGDARFTAAAGPLQFDRPGLKIGVVDGEGSHEFVRANYKHLENLQVFSGSDLSQCLVAVSAGQVDVGLSDALETAKYARAHADVVDLFAENPYDLTPIAWAVRQDDLVWKAFLDTAIETLEAQGKLARFEHAYDAIWRWTHPVTQYRQR